MVYLQNETGMFQCLPIFLNQKIFYQWENKQTLFSLLHLSAAQILVKTHHKDNTKDQCFLFVWYGINHCIDHNPSSSGSLFQELKSLWSVSSALLNETRRMYVSYWSFLLTDEMSATHIHAVIGSHKCSCFIFFYFTFFVVLNGFCFTVGKKCCCWCFWPCIFLFGALNKLLQWLFLFFFLPILEV